MGTPKKLRYRMADGRDDRIVFQVNSTLASWAWDTVTSSSTITWHVSGAISPIPAPQTTNSPTFDLSGSTGIVFIKGVDISGLTILEQDDTQSDIYAADIVDAVALLEFDIDRGELDEIDVTQQVDITRLVLRNNNLIALDLSQNVDLVHLEVDNNSLTSAFAAEIEARTLLTTCIMNSNAIGNVDLTSHTGLTNLQQSTCGLSGAQEYSNNTSLTFLKIANNVGIGSIDVTDLTLLTHLLVGWTGISTLNVTQCVLLVELRCNLNSLSSLDISDLVLLAYLNVSTNNMDSTNTDIIWNALSTIATNGDIDNGTLTIRDNRTAAADSAFTNLDGRSWTITETVS